MRRFVLFSAIIFVFLIFQSIVLAAENATVPACPAEIPLKTYTCADGSVVSCQSKCDPATGQIIECALPLCPEPAQIAPAQPVCAEVITHAVSPEGKCAVFPNSCIPEGWKVVDKCPEVQPVGTQLPEGCKEIKDEATGFVKVICEAVPAPVCPTYSDYDINKCKEHGGEPNFFEDSRGCKIFECRFLESGKFLQPTVCPSEEERQRIAEKCKANNMNPVFRKDFNGCMFVECVSAVQPERICPPKEEVDRWATECDKKGGTIIPSYDDRGCRTIICKPAGEEFPQEFCKPVPKEAFDRCREEGGEMIVKEENGCPVYAKCVRRGDERRVEYEHVEEIPKTSILLSLAFKLEQLKIEFDKLARQTEDIANYYASVGSPEAERFRKVSSMFEAAKTRIDEIKTKMRERITSLTRDDIAEFKHDLRYIKEVVIQDILYVMLSVEGAPVPTEALPAVGEKLEGCGSDGFCFNKALRLCEKTKFYPEGSSGPEVIIEGLEDKNCIIKASMTAPDGNTYDMTCKYPNYVMGMRGPDELLPYCSGSMVEMIKLYSPQQVQPEGFERGEIEIIEIPTPQELP